MTENEKITIFDGSNGNAVMNMLKFISENYEGDERTYIDKDGDEIVSSYCFLLVAHNSSGYDGWVLLNSLVKEITELKITKTARGFISLSFRCGLETVIAVELPHNVTFNIYKISYERFLEKIGREYGLQLEHLKGEIEHSVINKSNFADSRHIWEPYLWLHKLCYAFMCARHSMELQKTSGFGLKDCLTEDSLGWKCFGTYNKDREFYTSNDKHIRGFIRKSIEGGRVAALNRYFESNQCEQILNALKKI